MRAALLIAAKDLRQRLRDRSLFLMALVVPMGLALIMNLIFGQIGQDEIGTFAVTDKDRGSASVPFVDEVLKPLDEAGVIRLKETNDAAKAVQKGEADAGLIVPEGFTAAVDGGRKATIEVVGDAEEQLGAFVARSIAERYAAELRSIQLSVAVAAGGAPDPGEAAALAARAQAVRDPISLENAPAGRRQLSMGAYFAAGMAVFFLFFTVQFGVLSMLGERREGTLARLLAAPIRRPAILGGKLLSSFAVGVISMTVLMVAAVLLLGADWGPLPGVAALVVSGVLAATGIMAVVAAFAKTPEQASNWQSVIAVVLGILGGTFFPAAQMGGAFEIASYAAPHRWFLQGLAEASGGESVLVHVLGLLGFAAVTGGLAVSLLGRRMTP